MQNFEDAVFSLLSDQLEIDPSDLGDHRDLRQLGVDSVVALNVLFALEEMFNITIDEEQLTQLRTVGDLRCLIESLSRKQS